MASILNATTSSGLVTSADNSGSLQLATNSGTTAVTIDTSQNVGIGTASPSSFDASADNLVIGTTSGNNGITIAAGTSSASTINFADSTSGGGQYAGYIDYQHSSDAMRFGTNNGTERMRIDSSGAVLIGLNSSGGFGTALYTLNTGGSSIIAKQTNSTADTISVWNSATTGTNLFLNFYTEGTVTSRGFVDYNRGSGVVRYSTTSDATLKNLIGDSDKQKSLEILGSTRIREYAWKEDAEQKPQIGVIAQELYETYKGAVSVGGDIEKTDNEGNVTTEYRPWAVDKTAFTFHLIAGWQEHQRIIQEQKAIIAQLQADVAELKGVA
jgi:hypothetical protein